MKSANDCLNRQNDSDEAKEARDGWAQGILNKSVYTTRVFYRMIYIYIYMPEKEREKEKTRRSTHTYVKTIYIIYIYIYT